MIEAFRIVPLIRTLGSLLLLSGIALLAGGIHLISLDGSQYYLIIGLSLMLIGALLLLRRAEALATYALTLTLSGLWALLEIGLDWWQLVQHLSLWFAVGVLLLPVNRALSSLLDRRANGGGPLLAGGVALDGPADEPSQAARRSPPAAGDP